MLLWKKHFGWRTAFYENFNVTKQSAHRADLTAAVVAAINQTQALDLELHQFAQALFAASIAAYGNDYEADLANFRRWNKIYGGYVKWETVFLNYYRASVQRLKRKHRT